MGKATESNLTVGECTDFVEFLYDGVRYKVSRAMIARVYDVVRVKKPDGTVDLLDVELQQDGTARAHKLMRTPSFCVVHNAVPVSA